jgi:hypothetical protein
LVFTCQSLPVATSDKDHPETHSLHQIEMVTEQSKVPVPGQKTVPDEETLRQFKAEYFSAGISKRPVIDKYLGRLGADAMFDFLESDLPQCHGVAHELGQSIFAQSKDIAAALRQCTTRCKSGCMHGVLVEAFHSDTFQNITGQLASFCKDDTTSMHKPGNCAHGSGHALMVAADYNIAEALIGCSAFPDPAMQYYCATGAFMEYLVIREPSITDLQQPKSLHFPCDTYTQFPAACYRYKTFEMLETFGYNREKVVKECFALPPNQRLGCLHGLGWAYMYDVRDKPALLSEVCRYGTLDEQNVCIEGAIEKLSDTNEEEALSACDSLKGENACMQAAARRNVQDKQAHHGLLSSKRSILKQVYLKTVDDSRPLP